MLDPAKDPPTHGAWTQFREHGKFREWHKDGKGWYQRMPGGIIGRVFHISPGPRGFDGFIYAFPVGIITPPPPKLKPDDDPPTHIAWTQVFEQSKFRRWDNDGDGWVEETPDGDILSRIYHQSPGPRGFDGHIYLFPIGMEPPKPPPQAQAQRPGSQQQSADESGDE
jgi:hypothetical protein